MRKKLLHYLVIMSLLFLGGHLWAKEGPFKVENSNSVMLLADSEFDTPTSSIDINDAVDTFVDCEVPVFTLEKSCDPYQQIFTVDVDVSSLGSATSVIVYDNVNGPQTTASNPSVVTMGPYPYGVDITITVQNADDETCKSTQVVNSDSCPPIPCAQASPFCSSEGLFFESNDDFDEAGRESAPEGIDYDCLATTPNPAWYFLQIGESGDLTLHITQNTEYSDEGEPIGVGLDVDFIAWGPFESLEEACSNLTVENQVQDNIMGDGCSYSAAPEEDFGIVGAEEGDIYVLLITNYNGDPGFIQVTQTAGDGSTNCSIVDQNQTLACEGEEIILTTEYPDQLAYLWSKYNPETDTYETPSDDPAWQEASLTVTEGGLYRLQSYNAAGELTTEEFTVILSPSPETPNLPESISICDLPSVTLDATVSNTVAYGGVSYQWADADGDISGATDPILEVTEPGVYTVSIKTISLDSEGYVSETEFCITSYQVEVTGAEFTVDLGEDQTLCGQASYDIVAQVTGADSTNATYEWLDQDGNVVGSEQTLTVTNSGIYTANVTINGCVNSDSVNIEVGLKPELTLSANTDLETVLMYCVNDPEIPSYELNLHVDITNMDPAQTSIEWYKNGELIQGVTTVDYTVVYNQEGVHADEYTVVVGEANCTTSASVTTSVNIRPYDHPCKITEGLSPGNNDGLNDVLDLTYLNDRTGIELFEVYNRYGTKVYEKTDYTNQWHGQDKGGNELSTGTYFYVIKFKAADPVYGEQTKGWIYINQAVN